MDRVSFLARYALSFIRVLVIGGVASLGLVPDPAPAAPGLEADPPACLGSGGEPVGIAGIDGGLEIRLTDGRRVGLAGVEAVTLPVKRAAWLADGPARLYLVSDKPDRYGRWRGHVVAGDDRPVWINGALVGSGLALAVPDDPLCAEALIDAEDRARGRGAGGWGEGSLRIDNAGDPAFLREAAGYRLVRGRIVSVGETRSTIYFNFGRVWKVDFTVMIAKRDSRRFGAVFGDPAGFENKTVVVRGWVERRDGPLIRVTARRQIRIEESADRP